MRKSKTISLTEEAMDYVETKANELFGGNSSAFLNYLIMKELGAKADIGSRGKEQYSGEAQKPHKPIISQDKRAAVDALVEED